MQDAITFFCGSGDAEDAEREQDLPATVS